MTAVLPAPRCLTCNEPVRKLRLVIDGGRPAIVLGPCGHHDGVEFEPNAA